MELIADLQQIRQDDVIYQVYSMLNDHLNDGSKGYLGFLHFFVCGTVRHPKEAEKKNLKNNGVILKCN